MSLSLAELVRLLPPSAPAVPAIPVGIPALDAALQGGGLPRGRLTEIVGANGSGKTTLARMLVETTVSSHGWVAYIDAQRTLDARDWVYLGDAEGMWMIRPHDATRAAWCADVLLRSGAFALVVLDGAPALTKSAAVRLTRLARDGNAVFVVLGERAGSATQLGGAVRLVVERRTPEGGNGEHRRPARRDARYPESGGSSTSSGESPMRTIAVRIEKGGTFRTVEVSCAIAVARRLCAHPEVPDRRGVARGATGEGTGSRSGKGGSSHAHARRAASPPADVTGRTTSRAAEPPNGLRTAVARARALG
jgi:energy-coupling factor transporter ATP-binding protein EcfA2